MARDDKPHKAKNKKYADPKTGAFRHSDGDRRARGVMSAAVKDAIKLKKLMHELGGIPPEPPADEPAGDANE